MRLIAKLSGCVCGILFFCSTQSCGEAPKEAGASLTQSQSESSLNAPACNLNGFWGVKITVPIKWDDNGAVQEGSGEIVQYVRAVRKHNGTSVEDELQVCGIELPPYLDRFSKEHRTEFPLALLDGGKIPAVTNLATLTGSSIGDTITSEPAVIQIGLDMPDAATAEWPRYGNNLQGVVDHDEDGKPGVTLQADTTNNRTPPPTTITGKNPATHFYTAIRNITQVTATFENCNKARGTAHIPMVGGKLGLQSHVLGCKLQAGGECGYLNTRLLDTYQPGYYLDEHNAATAVMVRVPAGATCAMVRRTTY